MMKLGYQHFNINAPFPTKQCGHLSQTTMINQYADDLQARCLYLEDEDKIILHISLDLLAIDLNFRNLLQSALQPYYQKPLHLILSTTHTHYANDVLNKDYQQYLASLLIEQLKNFKFQIIHNPQVSFQTIAYDEIGKSRISGFHDDQVYLTLMSIYDEDKRLATFIIHNVHPTVLSADVPFFSSEFPGYTLKKLVELYPNEAFTWGTGASGDISTRFTRDGQDYESMVKLAEKLVNKISELLQKDCEKIPLEMIYHEEMFEYEHDFHEIDLSSIRDDLSPREQLSIEYGKILRDKLKESKDVIPEILIASLRLGAYRLVFYPNEIFSEYLNNLDLTKEMLVSYSNGYGPYILPIDFPYLTYESFCDTLSNECKQRISQKIAEI